MSKLYEREQGAFPLSIGTSLAIESICGMHPAQPKHGMVVGRYASLWINIRTLARNVYSAAPTDYIDLVTSSELATIMAQEIHHLATVIREASGVSLPVVLYYCEYQDVPAPEGIRLRTTRSSRQIDQTIKIGEAARMLRQHQDEFPIPIKWFRTSIDAGRAPNALLLSHIAYDLLSAPTFQGLTLLESHTGSLKQKAQWYTKYLNGKELAMIPFCKEMMMIFGDADMYSPISIKYRRALIALAKEKRWSYLTTRDKMIYNIKSMDDDEIKTTLLAVW